MERGSTAILDAYYASAKVLQPFRAQGLHLITRVRWSTVAHAPFCPRPGKHGPGRPRKWGAEVRLQRVICPLRRLCQAAVWLYGRYVTVAYQCFELYWDTPDEPVLFVLTQLPGGKPFILLASDVTLTGPEVIEAYGWRFKIEVSFRTLVQLLGGFRYRFWLKTLAPTPLWPQNLALAKLWMPLCKPKSSAKLKPLNGFSTSTPSPSASCKSSPWRALRAFGHICHDGSAHKPKHGYPSEQFVQLSLQHQWHSNLAESRQALLLDQLLAHKRSNFSTGGTGSITA
jgi:hypothetical protein